MMKGLKIRQVKEADNSLLAKLIREVFNEHNAPQQGTVYSDATTDDLYALFQKQNAVLWVAEINNEVIGCCGVYPTEGLDKDCAELAKFYLSEKFAVKALANNLCCNAFNQPNKCIIKSCT